jgi:type II secretory pathway component PulK
MRQPNRFRRGAILAVALATLLVVTLVAGVILRGYLQAHRQLRREQDQLQAQWLADSAIARALARRKLDASYAGETWRVELSRATGEKASGIATIKLEPAADQPQLLHLQVESQFPDDNVKGIRVQRELPLSPN